MDPFFVCSVCVCHIKTSEMKCPFCGADQAHVPRVVRRATARMSRGSWLAFGSTIALVACSGAIDPQSANDDAGSAAADASPGSTDGSSRDGSIAHSDAAAWFGNPAKPTFACGSSTCDRATEYCILSVGSGSPEGCASDDGGPFPSECVSIPTCECLSANMIGSCHCVVVDDGIGIECAGCYGSPPARLERLFHNVA